MQLSSVVLRILDSPGSALHLGLVVAATVAGCARAAPCPSLPVKPPSGPLPTVSVGEYALWMRAECASQGGYGNEASGRLLLTLAGKSPVYGRMVSDRGSAVTAETPSSADGWPKTPLYGFAELDFGHVGAPLCETAPGSRRTPTNPDVEIDRSSWSYLTDIDPSTDPALRHAGPIIVVGRDWRAEGATTDGCSMGLFIETWDGICYRGHWDHTGYVAAGSGSFRLCPMRPGVPVSLSP